MNLFFTSDEHYYHSNIIKYCDRPFNDINHMVLTLINNHNEVVGDNDIVYHCGDFSMNQSVIPYVLEKLKGKHYLASGNHDKTYNRASDHQAVKRYKDWGFESVEEEYYIKTEKGILWLAHIPLGYVDYRVTRNLKRPEAKMDYIFALHGHSHSKPEYKFNKKLRQLDCGVDGNNYKPYTLKEILSYV